MNKDVMNYEFITCLACINSSNSKVPSNTVIASMLKLKPAILNAKAQLS